MIVYCYRKRRKEDYLWNYRMMIKGRKMNAREVLLLKFVSDTTLICISILAISQTITSN